MWHKQNKVDMYPEFDQFEEKNFQVCLLINSTSLKILPGCISEHNRSKSFFPVNTFPNVQFEMSEIKNKFGNGMYFQPSKSSIFKQSHMDEIKNLFKKFNHILLFYIGHAHSNGDWAIQVGEASLGRINLHKISQIWAKERKSIDSSRLFIIMDSCFSGYWCKALQQSGKDTRMAGITIYAAHDWNQASNQKNTGLFFKCLFEEERKFLTNYKKLTENNQLPLRAQQGHQTCRIQKKQIITLYNIIRKSSNWVQTVPKPEVNSNLRQKQRGLILQAECKTPNCSAVGKFVYSNCGMGRFNVGKQLFQARCPECHQRTKRAIALHCYETKVFLEGIMDIDGHEHKGQLRAEGNETYTILDATNDHDQWSYLEVETKPL